MERGGESYYYLADGLGSITTITDSSQNTINSYTYDSFGSIIHSTGSLINPYIYTGREYDPETGLYYYRSRHYSPALGRFLQEDPIGFWGGVNFYTYCDNNPINWIDPWGWCKGEKEIPWWVWAMLVGATVEPTPYGEVITYPIAVKYIIAAVIGHTVYQATRKYPPKFRRRFAPGSPEAPYELRDAPGGERWRPPETPPTGKKK